MIHERIERFINYLLAEKDKVNVISKNMDKESILSLIEDTKTMEPLIKNKEILDVGSGNGILGVPIALWNDERNVKLIEPRKKKANFLRRLKMDLEIKNIEVFESGIEEYIKNNKKKNITMISRGFHDIGILYKIFEKKGLSQILLISSKEKCKILIEKENIKKPRLCDIKNRDIIKILSLENVSRETL